MCLIPLDICSMLLSSCATSLMPCLRPSLLDVFDSPGIFLAFYLYIKSNLDMTLCNSCCSAGVLFGSCSKCITLMVALLRPSCYHRNRRRPPSQSCWRRAAEHGSASSSPSTGPRSSPEEYEESSSGVFPSPASALSGCSKS